MARTDTISTSASGRRWPLHRFAGLRFKPASDPTRQIFGEPLRQLLFVSLGLMSIALTLVLLAVVRAPQLSITDEAAHASYAYSIAYGTIPAKGTLDPAEAKYEWYCHDLAGGMNPADPTGPAVPASSTCTSYDAAAFEPGAQEYTFSDPPVYYVITGYLDRAISPLVPGTHNFITVGRALGALWLFAAMIVLYLAARRFRVSWPFAFAAAALLPLCPGVLASSSEMTSDCPAVLCGALALYLLARIVVHKRLGLVAPFLVAAFSTGTKVLNGLPMLIVGGVCLCMALHALFRSSWRDAVRPALVAVSVGLGFLLVYGGWTVFQNHRGVANWVNPNLDDSVGLSGNPVGDFLSNMFSTFQKLTTAYWLQPQINGETLTIWATLLCVVFCAAPLLVMTASRARSWGWILGLSTFAGIAAVVPVVEAQVFLSSNNQYFALVAPRYALGFLPWVIVCLAVVAYRRRLLRSSYTFVSLGLLVVLLVETGVFTLGPALTSGASFLVG